MLQGLNQYADIQMDVQGKKGEFKSKGISSKTRAAKRNREISKKPVTRRLKWADLHKQHQRGQSCIIVDHPCRSLLELLMIQKVCIHSTPWKFMTPKGAEGDITCKTCNFTKRNI